MMYRHIHMYTHIYIRTSMTPEGQREREPGEVATLAHGLHITKL